MILRSTEQNTIIKDNCSTILCWPLPHVCRNQPQVYICPVPPESLSHFHPSRLSQSPGLSSLFYRANSPRLSVLHMECIYCHVILSIHPTLSFPHCVHKSVHFVCVSTAALQIGPSVLALSCFSLQSATISYSLFLASLILLPNQMSVFPRM